MDSFELNKLAGAVLFAGLIVLGINEISSMVTPHQDETARGYEVPGVELASHGGEAEDAAPEPTLAELLASADLDDGAKSFRKCTTCHTIDDGGANRVGPNLYDTVGASFGHIDGFNYSGALLEMGGTWGYEELDAWLENPRAFIPGNKMAYGGIRDAQERANLIMYLHANTTNPPPLPEVALAEPVMDEPAVEGEPMDEAPAGEEGAGADDGDLPAEDSDSTLPIDVPEENLVPADDDTVS
ncbi:MAG: c-type cytochrome [Alphaproteobacteria bacterium]